MTNRVDARKAAEESIIDVISKWEKKYTYGPSFRDVASTAGLSLGSVHALCRALRIEGRIDFSDNISRSLRVL